MRRFLPDATSFAALVSGLLLAVSFPQPDFPLFAWFGLVPLILTIQRRPFKSGFIAGMAFFAVVLYWLNIVMTTYGRMPLALSIVSYLLLVCYLALYWGTATWAACRLREKCHYPYVLTLPVLWVAMEFLRAVLLTGFPWATLGYSQQSWLPVIQSADLFGVYGISYLLILSNAVLADCWMALRHRAWHPLPVKALACLVVLLMADVGYGFWCLGGTPDARTKALKVGLIQGNIPQELKWRPELKPKTMAIYQTLSRQAVKSGGSDLLVWPEASVPFYFQDGGRLAASVMALPGETGSALLFGSPAYRRDDGQLRFHNSAYLIAPQNQLIGRSDKIHLVPFGEYVPLEGLLPFINKLVVGIGDFSPGEVNPLEVDGHQLGVLICYEVIFPELARDYVRQGSDLLVNITNDAWFGRSSAPTQHLAMARFRAIENRIWLARAANTGISAFITPSGTIRQKSSLFEKAYLVDEVGLGARPGLYAQSGDAVPLLFVLVSVLWLWQTRRKLA